MRVLRTVAVAGVLLGAWLTTVPAASAHDGSGTITVATAVDDGTTTEYTVAVTWENDGHPAADATVTATPIDPAGQPGTPVTLTATAVEGQYRGTVQLPGVGTWTVRFTVVTPTSTLEVPRVVTAPSTTSTRQATTTTNSDISDDELADVSEEGNGGTVKALIGGGLLLVIVGGAVLGFRRSTKRFEA